MNVLDTAQEPPSAVFFDAKRPQGRLPSMVMPICRATFPSMEVIQPFTDLFQSGASVARSRRSSQCAASSTLQVRESGKIDLTNA